MAEKGLLYLIPSMLGADVPAAQAIPPYNIEVASSLSEFIVENVRTARRFLLKCGITTPVEEIIFHPLNAHIPAEDINSYLDNAMNGKNIGLLSEAGCPGIADPGATVVQLAHRRNIRVIPLAGPSSLFMALMASGLNGQEFAFHGYLPKEKGERMNKLKQMEASAKKEKTTHIFIETPYRNDSLIKEILEVCRPETMLSLASDISQNAEQIHTDSIANWRTKKISRNNRPTVFLIGNR